MVLDELHAASSLLHTAVDRYLNVCLFLQRTSASCYSQPEGSISTVLTKELLLLAEHETKLRESRLAVAQSVKHFSAVDSISRLPIEALVQVFQLLIDEEYQQHFKSSSPPHNVAKYPKYPLVLSHVCTVWRQIVFHSPSLWSRIKLFPPIRTDERLQAYTHFHLGQARETPVHLLISESFPRLPILARSLSEFVTPLAGRIRSLELRLNLLDRLVITSHKMMQAGYLLAECLEANDGTLVRFALNMVQVRSRAEHLFMEGSSADAYRRTPASLVIQLPNDRLEDTLLSISDLWLQGLYFTWQSKAYHRLISLRLGRDESCSISKFHLMKILESSPQLKRLDIRLAITKTDTLLSWPPVYLPDLEVLVGGAILLQLIRPGLKELSVSIVEKTNPSDCLSHSAAARDFLLSANVVKFYSYGFLCSISDICCLFSLAPHLRDLAISLAELTGPLPEISIPISLESFYILLPCEIGWDLLREVVNRSSIKKVVFWGQVLITHDVPKFFDSQTTLEELASELETKNVQFEFVPKTSNMPLPVDLFMEPPLE